jgi:hypothetical protein
MYTQHYWSQQLQHVLLKSVVNDVMDGVVENGVDNVVRTQL